MEINKVKNHAEDRLKAFERILILKQKKKVKPIFHEFLKSFKFYFRINLGVNINVCFSVTKFFKEVFLMIKKTDC